MLKKYTLTRYLPNKQQESAYMRDGRPIYVIEYLYFGFCGYGDSHGDLNGDSCGYGMGMGIEMPSPCTAARVRSVSYMSTWSLVIPNDL